jgi:hypothetical protein
MLNEIELRFAYKRTVPGTDNVDVETAEIRD